jgi:hypothetical protein
MAPSLLKWNGGAREGTIAVADRDGGPMVTLSRSFFYENKEMEDLEDFLDDLCDMALGLRAKIAAFPHDPFWNHR